MMKSKGKCPEWVEYYLRYLNAVYPELRMSSKKYENKTGYYLRKDNGKFAGSSSKPIDFSGKSGIIKKPTTPDEVSALGENYFKKGFSDENLKRHWGGKSDHSDQYPEFTEAEQYNEYAKKIASSAADGKDILGYKTDSGTICRYKVNTNDYVKGNPIYDDIYTCFKPDEKAVYFHRHKRIDGGKTK